jgi:hypothetical protein
MNQGKRKLVVEPMLRGGGWKVTEIIFTTKYPPQVKKIVKYHKIRKWQEVKVFVDSYYDNEMRQFRCS